MAVYAIGDVQGCHDELAALLETLGFDPARDRAWFTGDLVNRGPRSLETLRLVRSLGNAAVVVLGNHDLHLGALMRTRKLPPADAMLAPVLNAPDGAELVDWLTSRPLAHYDPGMNTLMVHAGVYRDWSIEDTLALAGEVEAVLRGPGAGKFFDAMYGREPSQWDPALRGMDRLRFITNCLTRVRFCHPDGRLDFQHKGPPGSQADGLVPWFELPGRRTAGSRIVFGHWASLGYYKGPALLGLDTGCVWGRELTAARLDIEAPPVSVAARAAQ